MTRLIATVVAFFSGLGCNGGHSVNPFALAILGAGDVLGAGFLGSVQQRYASARTITEVPSVMALMTMALAPAV